MTEIEEQMGLHTTTSAYDRIAAFILAQAETQEIPDQILADMALLKAALSGVREWKGVEHIISDGESKLTDEDRETVDKAIREKFDIPAPPASVGEEITDLKRQLRLAQHNFEHYYTRYMAVTGKTTAECEAEWEKTNPIIYGYPSVQGENNG